MEVEKEEVERTRRGYIQKASYRWWSGQQLLLLGSPPALAALAALQSGPPPWPVRRTDLSTRKENSTEGEDDEWNHLWAPLPLSLRPPTEPSSMSSSSVGRKSPHQVGPCVVDTVILYVYILIKYKLTPLSESLKSKTAVVNTLETIWSLCTLVSLPLTRPFSNSFHNKWNIFLSTSL